jgi:hypothetical protein
MNTVMTATYFFNHAAPSVFAQLPEAKTRTYRVSYYRRRCLGD